MRHTGFRGWIGRVAVLALGVGCGGLPQTGGERPTDPQENFFGTPVDTRSPEFSSRYQYPVDEGYNGTIADLGSSIDPRTPEAAGTPGRSRRQDITGYMGPEATERETGPGFGGSGSAGQGEGPSDMGWRSRRGNAQPAPERGEYLEPW